MSLKPASDDAKERVAIDFDHHDSALPIDPYSTYDLIGQHGPVAWSRAYDGFWVLSDYESVYRATRDGDTFRSGQGVTIPAYPRTLIPIDTDAPQSQQLRGMVHDKMSPPAVAAMEPHIYEVATNLVDAFIERGECDFMEDFAMPLPVQVVLAFLMGIPEEGWSDFTEKMYSINRLARGNRDPDQAVAAMMSLNEEFQAEIDERRAHGLRDDVISALMVGQVDGVSLTDEEMLNYLFVVIGGGIFTTTSAVGHALVRMQDNPELREQLLARPELIPNAIEEFLRIDPPVQMVARTLSRDTEVGGCPMKAGERTLLLFGAANRDPSTFADPTDLDFERKPNRHFAFGMGLHRCLGSHVARTMFRVMLETILDRIPDYEILPQTIDYYDDIGPIRGMHHLYGRFTPGNRRNS